MAEMTDNCNYLQPTGFKISISPKNYPNFEYFAQSVNHPSVDVGAVEMPFPRAKVPFAGDSLAFGQVTFTILLDEDMKSYKEMYDWCQRLVEVPQTSRRQELESGSDKISTDCDITCHVLTSQNNANHKIKYYSATPVSMGDIEFSATNSSGDYLTFQMTFRFDYFEFV